LAASICAAMIARMQVISSAASRPNGRISLMAGSLVGVVLVGGGLALGWLLLATSFAARFTPAGRPQPGEVAAGIVAWAVTFVLPSLFLIVGVSRLASVLDDLVTRRGRATPASRLGRVLGDEYVVATRVRLPDGRPVPEIVVGPFGAAVIEELPPSRATRHTGSTWEVRTANGWMPLENPLERASRDADRVRRWFAQDDTDFVVKVFAAVVSVDGAIARIPSCAVIAPDQVAAWIASLPAQRSLTPGRRQQVVERLRELA
jgi:hypothetical protein